MHRDYNYYKRKHDETFHDFIPVPLADLGRAVPCQQVRYIQLSEKIYLTREVVPRLRRMALKNTWKII